jgi:hypothetical protein
MWSLSRLVATTACTWPSFTAHSPVPGYGGHISFVYVVKVTQISCDGALSLSLVYGVGQRGLLGM